MKELAEGVGLIAHQGVFDGSGQVPGKDQSHAGGQEGENGKAGHGVDHGAVDAVHAQPHGDEAQQLPLPIHYRGEGPVLHLRHAGAGVHLGALAVQDGQGLVVRVDCPHIDRVRAVADHPLPVGHHDGVDVLNAGDGVVQILGEGAVAAVSGEYSQHLGGVHEIAVQGLILHTQREQQRSGHAHQGSTQH